MAKKPYVVSGSGESAKLFGERPEKENRFSFSKVLCVFSDLVLVYCLAITTVAVAKYFKAIDNLSEFSQAPDLSFISYVIPAAFVFAGLTHTFYYNKERFANCIKLRFEYIKQLLMFKMNSGLYPQDEIMASLDSVIANAEMEADALISNDLSNLEMPQDNMVG